MLSLKIAALVVLCFLMSGCNLSQDTCDTMDAFKASFDRFAAAGEFSANTVTAVNGIYAPADMACENPGTVTRGQMIALATEAIFAIRQAMRESEAAYPMLRDLERLLQEAKE